MKTKLLKKVRKRYSISEYRVEKWMKYDKDNIIHATIWENYVLRNQKIQHILYDSATHIFERFDTYEEAVERLIRMILCDYIEYGKRRMNKSKRIKKWWKK